jgi:hypothetical protein
MIQQYKQLIPWIKKLLALRVVSILVKYKWIQVGTLYKYFNHCRENEYHNDLAPMTLRTFTRSVTRIGNMPEFSEVLHSNRKRNGENKISTYILLLDYNKKCEKNQLDHKKYSTFNDDSIASLIFNNITPPSTPPSTSSTTSTIQTTTPTLTLPSKVNTLDDLDKLCIATSYNTTLTPQDPLDLLAEAAISSHVALRRCLTNDPNKKITKTAMQTQQSSSQHSLSQHSLSQPSYSSLQYIVPLFDFDIRPQPNPHSSISIDVPSQYTNTICPSTKWAILLHAIEEGYDCVSDVKSKKVLINDIATYVSYMDGYHKVVGKYHTFCTWYCQYQDAKRNGTLESLFECKKKQIQDYLISNT